MIRRDVALYALGVGACGDDAVDEKELHFVYHRDGQPNIKVKLPLGFPPVLVIIGRLVAVVVTPVFGRSVVGLVFYAYRIWFGVLCKPYIASLNLYFGIEILL